MKVLQTKVTTLNTREFNKLSDKIVDALYDKCEDIAALYDIHINYIDDSWRIDFIPLDDNFPVLKVDTFIQSESSGAEILKISPSAIDELPEKISLQKQSEGYDTCLNYVILFESILALYDFEYRLS